MLTFAQFCATGRDTEDLGSVIRDFGLDGQRGRVYDGDTFLQRDDGDCYTLTLHNEGWNSKDLEQLEAILYAWTLTECPEGEAEERVSEFLCFVLRVATWEDIANAILGRCAWADICDENAIANHICEGNDDLTDALLEILQHDVSADTVSDEDRANGPRK